MKISVIVPVYNSSAYLKECLESLINQTFKDIEILCVYGKSKDNSLEILEEYSKKDNRIKIINEKEKGISGARNTGFEVAQGEFISFIDADDWVDLDYFERLYNAIIETNSDVAAASILRTRKLYKKIRVQFNAQEVFETLEDKLKACNIPKCCYVWNKLYKKELIKDIPFKSGVFYEDILWMPVVLKHAHKLVTVPNINYYYRANPLSSVKVKLDKKKQKDSYEAKKFFIKFALKNNIKLSKKEQTVTKSIKYLFNFEAVKEKEYKNSTTYYLFGIPVFRKTIKSPVISDNTFLVWEPCSKSHSEVVPGYVKYLLDLGYHVSVLVTPDRYKEGLFSKFKEKNVTYNKMNQKEIKKFFLNNSLETVKGVMVTTVGKICDCVHYEQAYSAFHPETDRKKLFFVEHEASHAVDKNSWKSDLITLRKLNYKGATSIVVNPHYFGEVNISDKNDITNFITIGAIRPNKKNSKMIIDSIYEIYNRGYRNFKLTVVGKGSIKHIPKCIRKYIDIKGRLPFKKMYEEIEKADFMLTSYNEYDPEHIRYNTSGTSGNFQLIYGFLKPCIIVRSFAPINGLNDSNSILYNKDEDYADALIKGINITKDEYRAMQQNLKTYQEALYNESLNNLKGIING